MYKAIVCDLDGTLLPMDLKEFLEHYLHLVGAFFQTKGYGHGAGMSQKGANAYASRGYSYKQILTHYYSNARVVG